MKESILAELGLTSFEIKIYLALLSNGSMTAYAVADKAGLYRQVTYDSLNRLLEKGFVNTSKDGRTTIYRAISPDLLLEYFYEKMEKLKESLPELKSMERKSSDKLVVETYKGHNVTRIALRDVINCLKNSDKKEVLCTSINESLEFSNSKTVLEQYGRDLIHYGIKERIMIREGVKGQFVKGTTTYRKLPEKYFNPNPVQIYGNNVQIAIIGNPGHLVIIRSKDVADSYRKQFELMWSAAKK